MTAPAGRIRSLDALRGLAVCGIMLVNTWQHTRAHRGPTSIDWVMTNLFQSRFYPIFSFLFGIGFALFLRSARERAERPHRVLLRRLAVLAAFGAAHRLVNSGDVLLPYAALGAFLLLPAAVLPAPAVLLLGAGTTAVALIGGEPYVLIAALFLLGLATVEYGGQERRPGPAAFAAAVVVTVPLTWWWNHGPPGGGVYQAAALTGAAAYASGFLLLARRTGRASLFEALGRMALTNYLTGTAVILLAMPILVRDGTGTAIVAVSGVTVAAQAAFSRWWLARHRYGPLEWVWRSATWWRPVPNGQTGGRDECCPVPDTDRARPQGEPGGRP
ncbi:DUF418 domain-containing protein [Microbispora sp. NPDC049125]|uniref:DUF418 domain-containing protein n=1 Tax=Microbispora sp. NPDC049125 TaxID=3154929 RepID=UPI003467514A